MHTVNQEEKNSTGNFMDISVNPKLQHNGQQNSKYS